MVIKFILLTTFCFNIDNEIKCGQYLRDNLSDASECISMANAMGKAQKMRIKEIGGSLAEYRAQCIAINKDGYDIDHSFNISYTIL
ncbi:hypothetical protein HTVC023P_gp10 [Pelagibacter phage HTVC023P]|nr:hypothetical protein HTVC023P_gp10 [Pelagibacter phage HTVC023P]